MIDALVRPKERARRVVTNPALTTALDQGYSGGAVLKITFAELPRPCSRNISPACCLACVTRSPADSPPAPPGDDLRGTIYSAAFVMHGGGRSIGLAAAVFSAYLLWQDFLAA
jgi:hypothetical protein